MKPKIHPRWNVTNVTCSCGSTFQTGSTQKNLRVEICSACHPFYTGKQKASAAHGQVEKFNQRLNKKAPTKS
ncbi:MAG TPA: 50S ribosomal protein L31 [Candidatus Xenobia bacterium]|jgi:large subunit ribosomal protein L31